MSRMQPFKLITNSSLAKLPKSLMIMSPMRPKPEMVIAILAISLILFSVGSMASYSYDSPPPSSPSPSPSPSPPPPSPFPPLPPSPNVLTLTFIGHVYCYPCYNDHHKKHALKGATVEVICKVGDKQKVIKEYGKTNRNGEYNITLEVKLEDLVESGAETLCEAKLYGPPKHSPCNIPTTDDVDGFEIESKGLYEYILKAKKPFAYATKYCPPPYYYTSPPSPSLPPDTTSSIYH